MMTIAQDLKESILTCMQETAENENEQNLIDRLNSIIEDCGAPACSEIFQILTNLEFSPSDAQSYWAKIRAHKFWLENRLRRKVTLRTTVCDYFSSEDVFLINPKIIEIHDFEEKIRISRIDFLTGLFSRKYFEERLEEEINRAKRHKSELSLIFFDLDYFKQVNDTYGHLAGDHILREVAKIIIDNRREGDITARYGGEEMIILLTHTNNLQALIYAERIRESIEKRTFIFESQEIRITISGGISSLPGDGIDAKGIEKAADIALYRAKRAGRNDIIVFSNDKRQYLRVDLVSEINVIKSGDRQLRDAVSKGKNLSKGGILFESELLFDLGSLVQLKVQIDDTIAPIILSGKVVRVESFEKNRYDIGVSFYQLEKENKQGISRYIVNQLKLNNLNKNPAIPANYK